MEIWPCCGSFLMRTVLLCINQLGWSPLVASFSIWHASLLWSDVSFFSQLAWIILGPGAIQFFRYCHGLLLNHWCLMVSCKYSYPHRLIIFFSQIPFQNISVSALGGSGCSTGCILQRYMWRRAYSRYELYSPYYTFSVGLRELLGISLPFPEWWQGYLWAISVIPGLWSQFLWLFHWVCWHIILIVWFSSLAAATSYCGVFRVETFFSWHSPVVSSLYWF